MDSQDILDRLTKLETAWHERWVAHDNQANERQQATCSKLEEIRKSIENMKSFCFGRQLDKQKLWLAVILAFLVPMITFAIAWGSLKEKVERLDFIHQTAVK